MDAGSKNAKIPQTKLAIAFPLVGRPERALLPVRRPPDFDFRMLQLRDWPAENCRTWNSIALNWDWAFGIWDRTCSILL
jgi:hypothetical protein